MNFSFNIIVINTYYPYNVAHIYYKKKKTYTQIVHNLFFYLLFDKQKIMLQNLYFNYNYIMRPILALLNHLNFYYFCLKIKL